MVIWIITFLIYSSSAAHFYLTEGYEKCFVIDVPEQTVVLGDYNLVDVPPSDQLDQGVNFKISDPDGNIISQKLVRGEGKFSFTSQARGQHRVCLLATSTS